VTGYDGLGDTPYLIDSNNADNYPLMNPWVAPDIAVANVAKSKTVVGQGFALRINVTVANQGNKVEALDLRVCANDSMIDQSSGFVFTGEDIQKSIVWNTSGFAKGNYSISAYAEPLLSEADTSDNNFTDGWIIVAMIGDITGPDGWPDGRIDVRDVAGICSMYGVKSSDPRYNINWDITGPTYGLADGRIDVRDVALISSRYGQKDP
jgi:hypothetical protein